MALTKAHMVETIQNQLHYRRKDSVELVESILKIMKKALHSGDEVMISGFGKFCINEKRARRGRNPATGDDLMLAPRRVITFKCSGKLRDKVNNDNGGSSEV